MPMADMRRLWLEGVYPSGFRERSPSSCLNASDSSAAGCDACLSLMTDVGPIEGFWNKRTMTGEVQRYCRCLASRDLSAHELDAIPAHRLLQCPRDPVTNSTMTVADGGGRRSCAGP